jgi:dihydropteroate synthase|tara:strand:- start:710 stop:1537 length:828 start_codon:yes stop_codon:yes gene_type:complete
VSKIIKQKGNSIDFSTPIVMGILNLTSDSFYDGGKYLTEENIIKKCVKIKKLGAKIIDIGACSSRPGSNPVSQQEELKRLIPAIKLVRKYTKNLFISVDTFRSEVAIACVENGADMINDISAGENDKNMFDTIIKLNVPYIMMHMKGNPLTMQNKPNYNDVMSELKEFFNTKIENLNNKGFNKIIIDPGFGFGKTLDNNYTILKNLMQFKEFNLPILIGASRKSMIYNILNKKPETSLNGTSIINTIGLINGASILRVHDVEEAMECIKITNTLK